jgi:hypothetical protein
LVCAETEAGARETTASARAASQIGAAEKRLSLKEGCPRRTTLLS